MGTVYRHFPDKEALMGELVRARFDIFNERLGEAIATDGADPFEALAAALRDNAASVAADAATRFAFMSGGERVFAHAAQRDRRVPAPRRDPRRRARTSAASCGATSRPTDIPMVMCGVCATIGKSDAGWDWRRHLELILAGMRAPA